MRHPIVLGVAAFLVTACGGDASNDSRRSAWTTVADSSADTIRVRITGDVPPAMIATLEPELRIGAVDGAEEVTFGSVSDVIPQADGGLLVHDQQAGLIRFYDAQGAYVKTLGAKGGGPGEYQQVNGIAMHPNGNILVWDASGGRINRYSADGDFIAQFRLPLTTWFTSNRLYSDREGSIYIWSPIREMPGDPTARIEGLIRLDTLGTVLDSMEYFNWGPLPERLVSRSPDNRSVSMTSVPFLPSSSTSLMPDGGYVTGYNDKYAFYILPKNGRPIRVERDLAPVPVTDTERTERRAQIEGSMRSLNPSWTWTGPDIPANKPAWTGLRAGDDGRIWVTVPQLAEVIPEGSGRLFHQPSRGAFRSQCSPRLASAPSTTSIHPAVNSSVAWICRAGYALCDSALRMCGERCATKTTWTTSSASASTG